jgi:hypothetical protein
MSEHDLPPADWSTAAKPKPLYDVPWNYGKYRVVIQRRVTEEEQISVECYEATRDDAVETYGVFMTTMREHMIAHNEKVVMVHQDRLVKLERQIEHRAQELRELEEEIEAARRANGPAATQLQNGEDV